jgi:hypothetical protein
VTKPKQATIAVTSSLLRQTRHTLFAAMTKASWFIIYGKLVTCASNLKSGN